MPKKLEEKLKREAKSKGLGEKRKNEPRDMSYLNDDYDKRKKKK